MSRIFLASTLLLLSWSCAQADDPIGGDVGKSVPEPPKVPAPKLHAPPEPLRTELYGRALDAPGDALGISFDRGGGLWLTSTEGVFYRPADSRFFLSLPTDHQVVGGLAPGLAVASKGDRSAALIRLRSDQRLEFSPFPTIDPQSGAIRSFELPAATVTLVGSGATLISLEAGGAAAASRALPSPVEASALALASGKAREVWVGSRVGVFRVGISDEGELAPSFKATLDLVADQDDDVVAMDGCVDGSVWISALGHGVFQLGTDGTVLAHLGREDFLPQDHVLSIACDPDGGVWFGTSWGGLVRRMRDGSFRYHTRSAGLPGDSIRSLVVRPDAEGGWVLWIATETGLASYSEG